MLVAAVVSGGCAAGGPSPVTVGPRSSAAAASAESPDPRSAPEVTYRRVATETPTYTFDASLPVVAGVDADVAAAIERHVSGWLDLEAARFQHDDEDFVLPGSGAEGFAPGFLAVRSTTGAATASLLSVAFTVTSMHQGMAHPETVVDTVTFDLTTGRTVALPELFAPGADVYATLSEQVTPLLVTALDPAGEGWAEAGVREGAAPEPELLRRFVIDEAGLTLHFDQYQVAPGASGPQAVTLVWDGLLDVLHPSALLRDALDTLA